MKRIFLITLGLILCFLPVCADDGATATFENRLHDFGYIKENGGPVSHTFVLTNTGSKPLIIVDATTSCGCTRPEFPTKPIKPGKKAKVKVTFNPLGRPGAFRKTVKVKTNGTVRHTTLVIEGTVTPRSSKK